jgi:Fic family protein
MWKPITDLPDAWKNRSSPELISLVTVWEEQAGRLRQSGAFKTYMTRLRREIAIETGIIERLYSLDRGVTQLLIEHGIDEALIPYGTTDRPVQQVVALIKDQEAAIEGLFDFVKGQRELSTSYIKQLHQLLTRNQKFTEALNPHTGQLIQVRLRRGDWKKLPNNPMRPNGSIHEYAPPEQVTSEMDKLIAWHLEHQTQDVSPEIEAAWLHHRFTQIHPFQDGNGRVARLLASLVFIKAGWFPLILTRDDRSNYISALEEADRGSLTHLVELFTNRQKRAFIHSLGLSERILAKTRRTKEIISSIADRLKQDIDETEQAKRHRAEEYAEILFQIAEERLQEIADEIRLSVENVVEDSHIFTVSASADDEKSHYYRYQVIETAKQLDYYANLRNYHSWIQLVIDVERPTMILVSFHVLGYEYHGLLACSVCGYHRNLTDDEDKNVSDVQALTDIPFQFSYADQRENLAPRYKQWLEAAIVSGLDYWNKSL